ncbi:hypothetical protein CCL23_16895 [Pseudomonas syringae]|nr:hypothetical protein CCL23_16895 [Pseudomonas syringae]
MAYQRFFYHPVSLWLIMLIMLLPASLMTWTLFWREASIRSGIAASSAVLFLAQGTTWASFIKLRHSKIDAHNRSFWLRALTGAGMFHITLFFLAALTSPASSLFTTFVLQGLSWRPATCGYWYANRHNGNP